MVHPVKAHGSFLACTVFHPKFMLLFYHYFLEFSEFSSFPAFILFFWVMHFIILHSHHSTCIDFRFLGIMLCLQTPLFSLPSFHSVFIRNSVLFIIYLKFVIQEITYNYGAEVVKLFCQRFPPSSTICLDSKFWTGGQNFFLMNVRLLCLYFCHCLHLAKPDYPIFKKAAVNFRDPSHFTVLENLDILG